MINCMVLREPITAPFLASTMVKVKVSLPSGMASLRITKVAEFSVLPSRKVATALEDRKSEFGSVTYSICDYATNWI